MVILLSGAHVGTVSPASRQEPIEVVARAGADLSQYVAQVGSGVDLVPLAAPRVFAVEIAGSPPSVPISTATCAGRSRLGRRCPGHQLQSRDLTVDVLPRGNRPGESARQPFRGSPRLLAIESGQEQATGAWVLSAGAYTGARLSPAVEPGEGRWKRRVPARGRRRRAECRRSDGRITR